ncbi:hypothetical protein [Bradyrhizobium sp. SZCCHNPS2010]|uniref:hypothetical protein n=1 Tax=Bradyrhizobium sp. SZCCHNPS2010 TaxID=3057333 RepID=UPI0029167BAB|nr:hypothetical protein [Bradyrhizobium sp. SZCCHNPS2010]
MSDNSILKLIQPGNVDDQLTETLRNGARDLLAQAVEAAVSWTDQTRDIERTHPRPRLVP